MDKASGKNRNTEEGNELWAFLPGFGFSLRDQKDRYDMLKPATAYLRSQILFNNMFVARQTYWMHMTAFIHNLAYQLVGSYVTTIAQGKWHHI
jgi:hypothetical protein